MTDTTLDTDADYDALVVGGGGAGLTAATFLARADLATLVVAGDESILRRNAHLENVPGFPAGVNPRLFADLLREQAEHSGADVRSGLVEGVTGEAGAFTAALDDGSAVTAARVVAASWADADYLDGLGVDVRDAGSKRYVEEHALGRTSVDGVYAAGRLAERYHQAVVAAGHGAEAAITLLHDAEVPFYHDWVVPAGYFTDRGREVPPGCEEITAAERERRAAESRETMREYFAEEHPDRQRTHPSLVDDDLGRVDDEWYEDGGGGAAGRED
ncbi:FAD-binding protein [Halobaculum gomorrense]|uniref:FAD binding domain-containing protein n=1 Tax=Halobaculum gomorrense TaxID=43928 RepID=A0A1M5P8Z5_9EURY|nr:FAD-binding protein [Halobaculum gomorrense]SHG98175.1 FAD binding domain-containing protein [Halobaculum gomorrense]